MSQIVSKVRLWLTITGLVIAIAGGKYMSSGWRRNTALTAAIVFLIAGCAAAWVSRRDAERLSHAGESRVWRYALLWQAQVAFAITIFVASVYGATGSLDAGHPVAKLTLAAWIVPLVTGLFSGVGVESAIALSGRGVYAEPERVRRAMVSWLKVGLLGIIVGSFQYVAVRKNHSWDLSYLKTAKASESTTRILESLPAPVEVSLFYPAGNEVLNQARSYFDGLSGVKSVVIATRDVEIDPVVAEAWKTGRNGVIMVRSDNGSERIETGLTLTTARKTLKNIDAEFQRAVLAVSQKKKTLYFTRGHGELDWAGGDGVSPLRSIRALDGILRSMNYNQKFFGVSEGSVREVPADADAVIIVGGTQDFLQEEIDAISTYVERGGHLFALLDVDRHTDSAIPNESRDVAKDPLIRWLAQSGIAFEPGVLANEETYVAATRSPADRWFLATNVFTSHESVATLARQDQRANVLTFRSGWLRTEKTAGKWNVFETVKSLSTSFVDENRDFKFNEGKERRGPRALGAVAEIDQKESENGSARGRIVVFADATLVSDALARNQANLVYFIDSLRWLAGESKVAGVPMSEEDVKIRHTSREDLVWFYGTVVVVPLCVAAVGAIVRRGSRRRGL
jgi:hypothetical protein